MRLVSRAVAFALGLALAGPAASSPSAASSAAMEWLDDDESDEDDALDGWIEGRIKAMSLREKIGQMLMVDVQGDQLTPALQQHLAKGDFGGVILFSKNLKDADQTRHFIAAMQDQAKVRTGIPLLVAVDQEGGLVNRLGGVTQHRQMRHGARTLGSVMQYAPKRAAPLVDKLTGEVARWMKELGFNMNLAPVLDLTDDRSSYIYDRSYGSDPDTVARVAGAYVDTMERHGIATTGKHFPNLSRTVVDSHLALPVLDRSLAELRAHEFRPFAALKDRLSAIMVGHVLVPQIDPKHPTSVSPRATRILRRELGYDGVLVSDDLKMKALSERYPFHEMIVRAVHADLDLLILAWDPVKQLQAIDVVERAVRRGILKESTIDQSVRRLLTLKSRYAR